MQEVARLMQYVVAQVETCVSAHARAKMWFKQILHRYAGGG